MGDRPIVGFRQAAQFRVPSQKAEIVAATPDGKRLIVTNETLGSVTIVSVEDLRQIHVVQDVDLTSIYAEAEVTSVAVTPDGKYALAALRAGDDSDHPNPGHVAIIDLADGRLVGSLQVGIGPDAIKVSPDGRFAVVANEDEESGRRRPGTVSIIMLPGGDPLQAKVTTLAIALWDVPGASRAHDPQPEYVAISPDSEWAAVTLQENNAIAIIDLQRRAVHRRFSVASSFAARPEPDGIAWTLDGEYLVTANEGGRSIAVWDLHGSLVWESGALIADSAKPEHVLVTRYGAQQIIVVAAERANALYFFDATRITSPVYLGALPTGVGPESTARIPGTQLIVSADEVSGTLTFFLPVR